MQPFPAENFQYRAAAISVGELPENDLAAVRMLYSALYRLYERIKPDSTGHRISPDEVCALPESSNFSNALQALEQLTLSGVTGPIAKAYHDIRSGSLAALTMMLDLFKLQMGDEDSVERLYGFCRDHLKIMRNCIYDLDEEGFKRDLLPVNHNVDLLISKWADTHYCIPGAQADIRLETEFQGVVSSCCMEFAALDRALYNLVNNATRFTANGRVDIGLVADKPEGATNLMFSVSNYLSADSIDALQDKLAANNSSLPDLFNGGLTMNGNGFGMSICADLVCHNYSIDTVEEALEQNLIGVELKHAQFRVWFYCPGKWC